MFIVNLELYSTVIVLTNYYTCSEVH